MPFQVSLSVLTSSRFCALSTFSHSILAVGQHGPIAAGLHLAAGQAALQEPVLPCGDGARCRPKSFEPASASAPVRLPSHAGPRKARLKPDRSGTGNLGQAGTTIWMFLAVPLFQARPGKIVVLRAPSSTQPAALAAPATVAASTLTPTPCEELSEILFK